MSGVSLLDNDSSTNMLLAEEFIDDHCLYPVHEFDSEETDDSQIDTAIHEPEGVGCTDHTVELAEVLEPVVDDHNVGQPFELFPPLLVITTQSLRKLRQQSIRFDDRLQHRVRNNNLVRAIDIRADLISVEGDL